MSALQHTCKRTSFPRATKTPQFPRHQNVRWLVGFGINCFCSTGCNWRRHKSSVVNRHKVESLTVSPRRGSCCARYSCTPGHVSRSFCPSREDLPEAVLIFVCDYRRRRSHHPTLFSRRRTMKCTKQRSLGQALMACREYECVTTAVQ